MTDEPAYAGMTVNERLFAAGELSNFDRAALARDREEMIRVLIRVEFSASQAESTVSALLAAPQKYGY